MGFVVVKCLMIFGLNLIFDKINKIDFLKLNGLSHENKLF